GARLHGASQRKHHPERESEKRRCGYSAHTYPLAQPEVGRIAFSLIRVVCSLFIFRDDNMLERRAFSTVLVPTHEMKFNRSREEVLTAKYEKMILTTKEHRERKVGKEDGRKIC